MTALLYPSHVSGDTLQEARSYQSHTEQHCTGCCRIQVHCCCPHLYTLLIAVHAVHGLHAVILLLLQRGMQYMVYCLSAPIIIMHSCITLLDTATWHISEDL